MRLNKLWLPALAGLIAWLGFTVASAQDIKIGYVGAL